MRQVGPDDLRRNALAGLLVQCLKREAFYQLRTIEQVLVWHAITAPCSVPDAQQHAHVITQRNGQALPRVDACVVCMRNQILGLGVGIDMPGLCSK